MANEKLQMKTLSICLILPRLLGGLLLPEWFRQISLGGRLRVIVIIAVADRFVIFGDCAFALSSHIPAITAIDVRPDFYPIRSQISGERLVEGIEGLVPIALIDIDQSQIVPGPGVASVEFDRRLELLFGLDVLPLTKMLDPATNDHALF